MFEISISLVKTIHETNQSYMKLKVILGQAKVKERYSLRNLKYTSQVSTEAEFSTLYKISSFMSGMGDLYDKIINPKNGSYVRIMKRKEGREEGRDIGRKKGKTRTFIDVGLQKSSSS